MFTRCRAGSVVRWTVNRQGLEVNGDWGNRWLTTNEAGSGPFRLDSWQAKDVLNMSRNPQYWRGEPRLTRVVFRHFQESQTLRLMIEKGDLDIANNMAVSDVTALSHDPAMTVDTVKKGTIYYVAMSMRNRLCQPESARGGTLLIDYQGIGKALMTVTALCISVDSGRDARALPDPGYRLDIPRAKPCWQKRYPDGCDTTLRVLADQPSSTLPCRPVHAEQAGIRAKIVTGTGNQIYGAMRERKFDMLVGRGGSGVEPHPHSSLRALVYNPDNNDAARLTNFQGWRTGFYDKQLNTDIDQALLERDPEKQKQDYFAIQERYDALIPALVPLSQMVDSIVVRKDVKISAAPFRYHFPA